MQIKRIKTSAFRKFKNTFETKLYDVTSITGKNTSKSTTNSVPGSKRVVCPRCNGRGKYKTWNGKEETRCSTCGGTGYKYK